MDPAHAVRERIEFDEWFGANQLDEELYVSRFFVPDAAVSDLSMVRSSTAVGRGRTQTTVWVPGAGMGDTLVRIDVSEQPSRAAAHVALPRILTNVQSPALRFDPDDDLGDVRIGGTGPGCRIFARANLVVVVTATGRDPVDVDDIARRIDQHLIDRPPDDATEASPSSGLVVTLDAPDLDTEESVIGVDADASLAPSGEPAMLRIFSATGEVSLSGTDLVYRPSLRDRHRIRVYAEAVDPARRGDTVMSEVVG